MDTSKASELFNIWFVKPLEILKAEIGPDAGWVALMVTLPLYERWIRAKLKTEAATTHKGNGDKARDELIWKDLGLDNIEQAQTFWSVMRDGISHSAMPRIGDSRKQKKADNPRYVLHTKCSAFPVFGEYDGKPIIYINPWKFADHVIQLLKDQPNLIFVDSKEFPLASVEALDEDQLRKYCPD